MVSNDLIKVIYLSLFVLIMEKKNFFLTYPSIYFTKAIHLDQIDQKQMFMNKLEKLKGTVSVISSDPPMQRW